MFLFKKIQLSADIIVLNYCSLLSSCLALVSSISSARDICIIFNAPDSPVEANSLYCPSHLLTSIFYLPPPHLREPLVLSPNTLTLDFDL